MVTPPPLPPTSDGPSSRLRRTRGDRIVAGVCGGVARELHVDPLIVRGATVLLGLLGGLGLVLYCVAALVVPEEGSDVPLARKAIDGEDRTLALVLVVVGGFAALVLSDGGPFGSFWWGPPWFLIGGAALFFYLRRERRNKKDDLPAASPTAAQPSAFGDEPTLVAEPVTTAAPDPRRPRSSNRIAMGTTLVAIGAVGAIAAVSGDSLRWDVLLASAVIVVGAVLVFAAPFGGSRALIPLGLVLALFSGVAAAADLDLRGGAGDKVVHPQTAAEMKLEYHLAAGHMVVDLRDVDLPAGTTIVKPEMGFGELVIRAPESATVTFKGHVSGGEIEAFGREANGLDADLGVTSEGRSSDAPNLQVDARVGFGHIAIVRGDDKVPGRSGPRHGSFALGAF